MSYLYDSLRDALGGKAFKSGTVIKDWSPNEVRAIYIMRDFILIADYLKPPKIVQLDANRVGLDLMNPSRKGSLNSLLENRQLSCMEEIYVDSMFKQYRDAFNLDIYIRSLYNQQSRLRYYGYVSKLDCNMLQNLYHQALINGTMDITLAKNIGGFSYEDMGNDSWYSKYNLRPQYYTMDGEKGKLHTYFSKCEKVVGESIAEKDKKIELLSNVKKIVQMFKVDISRAYDIKLLMEFVSFCNSCDKYAKGIATCIHDWLVKSIPIEGLFKEDFQQACNLSKLSAGGAEKFLMGIYQKVSAFDTNTSASFSPSDVVMSDGIYQLEHRIDCGLSEAITKLSDKGYTLAFWSASKSNSGGLPEGKLVEVLRKKNLLFCDVTPGGNIQGLLQFAYGVCGFRKEDFEASLNNKAM